MQEKLREKKLAVFAGSAGLLFDEGQARHDYLCRQSKGAQKNRVRSYFTGTHDGKKTYRLVNEIADFEYIVTSSNLEALIFRIKFN
ncbi:hypothetical protein GCM10020331_033850 [Ectobacillus funiculus]